MTEGGPPSVIDTDIRLFLEHWLSERAKRRGINETLGRWTKTSTRYVREPPVSLRTPWQF